jgi:hypothetical protein
MRQLNAVLPQVELILTVKTEIITFRGQAATCMRLSLDRANCGAAYVA